MKEGIFNQIMGIKTVLKSCFNDLKTIYSPSKIYNLLISRKNRALRTTTNTRKSGSGASLTGN